jgi:uncharacterized protein (TIGR03435 family)
MVQTLLEDRFKLTFHHETRQLPVFALVLDKPGKTGPQLRLHPDDTPCSVASPNAEGPPATITGQWSSQAAPGRLRAGARNVPMSMIVDNLFKRQTTGVDRPILDKTGLTGNFDFTIEFVLASNLPLRGGEPPDPDGPTFEEALKEQLGLKLEPQNGPTEIVIIDHVEEPSEN